MFAYGAALSFDLLHTIAQAAGLSPVLAWRCPLGFETFMAVAVVAVPAEQRVRPGKTPWYPWVLTALAAGSSIALNFGHPQGWPATTGWPTPAPIGRSPRSAPPRGARRCYDRHRAAGNNHAQALRALGNRLVGRLTRQHR
jgi:uncharacterized protein DUF2637